MRHDTLACVHRIIAGGRADIYRAEAECCRTEGTCPTLPDDQLWAPGGTARFGSDKAYADEGPAYTARIRDFWIDRHEVTNAQYAAFTPRAMSRAPRKSVPRSCSIRPAFWNAPHRQSNGGAM